MKQPKFDYKGGDYRTLAVAYTFEQLVAQMQFARPPQKGWLLEALILKDQVAKIWEKQRLDSSAPPPAGT